jgi:hypothetical protein
MPFRRIFSFPFRLLCACDDGFNRKIIPLVKYGLERGRGERLEQNDYLGERFSACRSTDETFRAPTRDIIKIYRD